MRATCIEQFKRNAPKFVVVAKERRTAQGVVRVNPFMEDFPELKIYFEENYELDKEFPASWVYRRKGSSDASPSAGTTPSPR